MICRDCLAPLAHVVASSPVGRNIARYEHDPEGPLRLVDGHIVAHDAILWGCYDVSDRDGPRVRPHRCPGPRVPLCPPVEEWQP